MVVRSFVLRFVIKYKYASKCVAIKYHTLQFAISKAKESNTMIIYLLILGIVSSSTGSPITVINATSSSEIRSFDFGLDKPSNIFPIYLNGALNVSSQGQPTISINSTSIDLLTGLVGSFLETVMGSIVAPSLTKSMQQNNSTTHFPFHLNGTISIVNSDNIVPVYNQTINISN